MVEDRALLDAVAGALAAAGRFEGDRRCPTRERKVPHRRIAGVNELNADCGKQDVSVENHHIVQLCPGATCDLHRTVAGEDGEALQVEGDVGRRDRNAVRARDDNVSGKVVMPRRADGNGTCADRQAGVNLVETFHRRRRRTRRGQAALGQERHRREEKSEEKARCFHDELESLVGKVRPRMVTAAGAGERAGGRDDGTDGVVGIEAVIVRKAARRISPDEVLRAVQRLDSVGTNR